jgi:hypothetical protein
VAGNNAFLLATSTFQEFQTAIETKVAYEIQGAAPPGSVVVKIPEPSSILLLFTAFSLLIYRHHATRS